MRIVRFNYVYKGRIISQSHDLSALTEEMMVHYPHPYPEPTLGFYMKNWEEIIESQRKERMRLTESKKTSTV